MNNQDSKKENIRFSISVILLLVFGLLANLVIEAQPLVDDYAVVRIDDPFKGYYKLYTERLESEGIDIPKGDVLIQYNSFLRKTKYLGVARGMWMPNLVFININPNWNNRDMSTRKWVMFHELTHDIFNIEHGEIDLMAARCPEYLSRYDVDDAMDELVQFLKNEYDWNRVNDDRTVLGSM